MALERPGDMMAKGMEEEAPEAEVAEEVVAESASIPLSILGGQTVTPGDVVRLEVVSLDDENGVINVKYAKPKAEPKKLGVDAMAAEFD